MRARDAPARPSERASNPSKAHACGSSADAGALLPQRLAKRPPRPVVAADDGLPPGRTRTRGPLASTGRATPSPSRRPTPINLASKELRAARGSAARVAGSPPRIILALSQDLPAQPQGSKPAVSTSNARLRARTASPPPGMPQNRRTRAVRRGAVSFGGRRAPAADTPTPAPRRGHRHGARPALPATPLPPPPPRQAPPPRIRIAPFDEPLAYTVPLHLVTGRGDVDPINERISGFYTQIAGYRKEIYDVKVTNNILNWVSFARSVADLRAEVDRVRKQASALRECVRNLGAKAFEEPAAFCEVM
ncbi:unnamed protein product [Urochloa humidicola]